MGPSRLNLVENLKFDSGGCWSSVDCQMMAIRIIRTRGQFPSTSSAVLSLHSYALVVVMTLGGDPGLTQGNLPF